MVGALHKRIKVRANRGGADNYPGLCAVIFKKVG
jgi:hypothetical protein